MSQIYKNATMSEEGPFDRKAIEDRLAELFRAREDRMTEQPFNNLIEVSVWTEGDSLYESYKIGGSLLTGRGGFLMFWDEIKKESTEFARDMIQFKLNDAPIEKDELFKIMRYEEVQTSRELEDDSNEQ